MRRRPSNGALTQAQVSLGERATAQVIQSGAFPGGAPFAAPAPGPPLAPTNQEFGLARTNPATDDPAFQAPSHPLKDRAALVNRVRVITRDVPNVSIQIGWTVAQTRSALTDLVVGLFDTPSQLLDNIAGDSRVQSSMRSRSGGLLGCAVRFKPAKHPNKDLAKKACRRWEKHWANEMHAEPALLDLLETSAGIGFSYSQLVWDTAGDEWKPYLKTFSTRYSWYHWVWRQHIAVTLDGMYPITGGDGHWVIHAPYGQYRGWMRSAMWPLAQWWLARNYALRDWARYSERHGFPVILADTPFGADPDDIANYQAQLQTIGQESILQLPGSVDVNQFGKYDLRYLEPKDRNWQAFKELIEQCNDEITLALLGQNLTSQVKEGSLAAARVHADVRQAILEADARALAKTLHVQVLRPWAALNFEDPDLAPSVQWDVRPEEDLETKARTFSAFAQALNYLRTAGITVKNAASFAKRFGLVGMELEEVPPVQIEAQLARATGKVDDASAKKLTQVGPVPGTAKPAAPGEKKPGKAGVAPDDEQSGKPDEPEKPEKPPVDKARKAVKKIQKQVGSVARQVREIAARIPDHPKPAELSFQARHAAFLADLREMEDQELEVDIVDLARRHNVPVPKRKKKVA